MALPNSIDAAAPAGSDSPGAGDDQIRALKQFIEDVFGIPDATSITVALFAVVGGGLDEIIFRDGAANPSAANRMRRSGTNLIYASEGSHTNSVATGLTVQVTTSGTPAAGIGTGLLFRAESGDENPSDFGRLDFAASDVTAASEDTYLSVLLRVAGGALDEKYRFGSTAGSGFTAIFAHAVTADRTYTLQDATDTLVGRDTTDTLTNKTLTAPVLSGTVTGTYTIGGTPTIGVSMTWSAAQNLNSQALTNVNIDSGTIDGVTITSPTLAGTYTIGGTPTLGAALAMSGAPNLGTAAAPAGTGFFTLLDLEPTSSTAGQIRIDGTRVFHAYSPGATENLFIGQGAGNFTLTGVSNVGVGRVVLVALTSGTHNVAVGGNALGGVTSGGYNNAFGVDSLANVTTSNLNTAVGHNSGYKISTGEGNSCFGQAAGFAITTGGYNIAIGVDTMYTSPEGTNAVTGSNNIAIGRLALAGVTTGGSNVGIGTQVLESLTSGSGNVAIRGGAAITTGIDNKLISGGNAITTGWQNFGFGEEVLNGVTTAGAGLTGRGNIGIGYRAGGGAATAGRVTTGTDGIFIGNNTEYGSGTQRNNVVAIGANALVDAANTVVLGGTGASAVVIVIGATAADANVGLGGLYLNQAGIDTQILALASTTDVAHGLTTGGFTAMGTGTYAAFLKQSATEGGLHLACVAEDGGSSNRVLQISAAGGTPDATDTSGSYGLVHITVAEHDAANALANSGATANIFTIAGRTAGAEATRFLVKANGDVHVTNTTLTALDDVPDALVARAGRAAMAPEGHWLHEEFKDLIRDYKHILEDNRIMFFEPDGSGAMQNVVPSIMLAWDGLYQAHRERENLRSRVERLERLLEA